jgi:hypothetical protein
MDKFIDLANTFARSSPTLLPSLARGILSLDRWRDEQVCTSERSSVVREFIGYLPCGNEGSFRLLYLLSRASPSDPTSACHEEVVEASE